MKPVGFTVTDANGKEIEVSSLSVKVTGKRGMSGRAKTKGEYVPKAKETVQGSFTGRCTGIQVAEKGDGGWEAVVTVKASDFTIQAGPKVDPQPSLFGEGLIEDLERRFAETPEAHAFAEGPDGLCLVCHGELGSTWHDAERPEGENGGEA